MPEMNKQPPNDIKMSFTFNNLRDILVRKIRKLKNIVFFRLMVSSTDSLLSDPLRTH